MVPIPWSQVRFWRCTGCGICCMYYNVTLKFDEWLRIVQKFGIGVTEAGLNKLYLAKKADGSCIFLSKSNGVYYCMLQDMKPLACKLWPFKILSRPKYGRSREAEFNYNGRRFYVYVDPFCPEIRLGKPMPIMIGKVIPEFIEIALGIRKQQIYTTGNFLPRIQINKNQYRLI